MTTSTILSMVVALGFPALIAFVTKSGVPEHVKVLLLLLLSTAVGILGGLITSPPATLAEWEHVLLNILMTFLAGAASDVAAWKPTGAAAAIQRRTPNFGFGPPAGKHAAPEL